MAEDSRLHDFYSEPQVGNYKGFYIQQQKQNRVDGSWNIVLTDNVQDIHGSGVSKGEALSVAFDQIDELVQNGESVVVEEEKSMDEERFGSLTAELIYKKNLLVELKDRQDGKNKPEIPEGPIPYNQAREIKRKEEEFSLSLDDIAKRLTTLKPEIEEIENDIKREIPLANTKIQITGRYNSREYNILVEYIQRDGEDRIEIRED